MLDPKNLKDTLQRELNQLATLRDELKLHARLARTEIEGELTRLELRWHHVQDEVRRLSELSKGEVETSGRRLVDELKSSYERLKQELKM